MLKDRELISALEAYRGPIELGDLGVKGEFILLELEEGILFDTRVLLITNTLNYC